MTNLDRMNEVIERKAIVRREMNDALINGWGKTYSERKIEYNKLEKESQELMDLVAMGIM